MTFLALALALAQTQTPTTLHSRIISAAIFKPGLAMLVREVEVPAGRGFYALDELPDPVDGSFWYSSPDNALVSEVDTAIRLEDQSKTYEAKTIAELIYANVGKHLTMKVAKYNNEPEALQGTLVNLEDRDGNMLLKLDDGKLRSASISQIIELDPTGLETKYERAGKVPTLHVQFKVNAAKPGHVRFTTIEPGAAWNASYLVDLANDGGANVQGKAQLGLGGLKFQDTETRLMAGFPDLPTNPKHDLSAGYGSLESYVRNGQSYFQQYRPAAVDPYDLFATWLQQMQLTLARYTVGMYNNYAYGFGGGGGMGGAGVDLSGLYSRGAIFSGTTPGSFDRSGQLLPNDTSVFRSESLYAYPIGSTSLEPGDRMTKLLFEQHSHYRTIYQWDAADAGNAVQQLLRVHNDGKTPWTGGLVTITKTGIPLAQTDMPFTATGKDADLGLGKAPDVLMSKDVQEIKAEPLPDPKRPNVISHHRLTEETKIAAENTKDEPITLEIVLVLEGDVKTEGAKLEKLPRRFTDINGKTRITWQLQLGPGEVKHVSATNTYVR